MTPIAGTYRLQLHAGFGFADAEAVVPYLAALGVTHLYLSPVLQAAPGSMHGYDVVDHSRVWQELGGEDGLRRLAGAAGAEGLGIVVDVVPNHMALPTPERLNRRLWDMLGAGRDARDAHWFDVDWDRHGGILLLPVLGAPLAQCLARGEITLDRDDAEPVVRYFDHVLPVRPGTEDLPLEELLDRQAYRLAYWRLSDEELNYRRFFEIDTLAGVRVELPDVFAGTHEVLLGLRREGLIDGFRIDHPDGLADPRGYLRDLRAASDGAWVVVEKILEGDERLPADWACEGTTGYDALNQVLRVFVDPEGAEALRDAWTHATGDTAGFDQAADDAKRLVLTRSLRAEVDRLTRIAMAVCASDRALRDHAARLLERALVELLAVFSVYRAYVVPGDPPSAESVARVEHAAQESVRRRPELADEVRLLADLALGRLGRDALRDEFCVRFQQTCGPVMAKGVEDTAFYRWFRLSALNEVGGDPGEPSITPDALHAWALSSQARQPFGMTALSTHDTKRSEDVRARLAVLSELPGEWAEALTRWRAAAARHRTAAGPDAVDEVLMWQTIVGAWPIPSDRLTAYLEKAAREGKRRTSWVDPDEGYEEALRSMADRVLADPALRADVARFVDRIAPYARVNTLGMKLVQLTLPGVADTYQGTELARLDLVDPDNRRPVDYDDRRRRLARLDAGEPLHDLDDEKLLVTSRALRLRAAHPLWFAGPDAAYAPLPVANGHALAFLRGGRAATVATRLSAGLEREGGWGAAAVVLPDGLWRNALTGAEMVGGAVPLALVLDRLPVGLLVREDAGV